MTASKGDGGSVSCGSGLAADPSAAGNANDSNGANIPIPNQVIPHTDVVAQCSVGGVPQGHVGDTAGGHRGRRNSRRGARAAVRRCSGERLTRQMTRMRAVLRSAGGSTREMP
ncbi:hypothetical protein MMRN_33890 [Mycobacterium marinum]|nr:hypothetical protein MMRN_33890 [Mycobacterium marinum]